MFGSYAYEPIINRHQDNLLVRLNKLLDWSFVEEEVVDCYSTKGQNAIHPLRLFKMLVIQDLKELSDRDTIEEVEGNIFSRYFVGLGLDEIAPHWTELGKFKERLGEKALERLFYRVIEEAEKVGIVTSEKRTVDATDVKANVDLKRCAKDKKDDDDDDWIDRNSSDKDADFGRKSTKKSWYGYKSHINQDPESELITAVITTPASNSDGSQLVPLIDKERDYRGEDIIKKQGGDKGYVGHEDDLQDLGIKDYTIPKNNMKAVKKRKEKNKHYLHLKYQRYKVEQKFAEAKQRHGLTKTRYRGLLKVHWQCLITFMVINLKRMVTIVFSKTA
jgi:IS5 family transposase